MSVKVLHLIDSGGLYGAEKMLLGLVSEQLKLGLYPLILSAGAPGIEEKALEAEARRLGLPLKLWRMKPGFNLKESLTITVICNPVVQIAALKQPVYCAQFPAVFQG